MKFAVFWVNFGMPKKSRTKNAQSPGCPPPSWRWGFGGRRRTLPWYRGEGKKPDVLRAERPDGLGRDETPQVAEVDAPRQGHENLLALRRACLG